MSLPTTPREHFTDHPIAGAAYTSVVKAGATVLMIGIVVSASHALESSGEALDLEVKLAMALAGLVLVFSYWSLLRSTIVLDGVGIRQSAMGKPPLAWDDIRSAQLVRSAIGTRLIVQWRSGRETVVHAGSDELSAAFALVARYYL